MTRLNDNFLDLSANYLFTDIARKVADYKTHNPEADIIRLGIGDVTQPLCQAAIDAMHKAVDEMADERTFRGYGPEHGYEFLRETIVRNDFLSRGISLDIDEVFINDGAKSDTGNIGDILSTDNIVCMTDPVYPVYMDANVMAGRRVVTLPCTAENGFVPDLPQKRVDVIYLCYPNNPTGTAINRSQLERWVTYALANDALILYDAAYEAYIQSTGIPHSVYEIPGAERCAIEFHSFSKTAGFTGVRCGYTIVPHAVTARSAKGERIGLNTIWNRRQCTKFNGTSYIQQRAAEATYSPEGRKQVRATIQYYMENARIMREHLANLGFTVYGGQDAPYLWLQAPRGQSSWDFFEQLLHGPHIVGTPGVGFGEHGEGYLRLTAFGRRDDCLRAMQRLRINS